MQGTFQITNWDEQSYTEASDGSKKALAKISQTYSGDLNGESSLQYLMSYQSDGTAVFVGFEEFTGTLDGRSGSFTLQHQGKFENGIASSNFTVLEKSTSGELQKLIASGSFQSTQGGQAEYSLKVDAL